MGRKKPKFSPPRANLGHNYPKFAPAFPSTKIQGPLLFGFHSGMSFRSDLSVYQRPIAGKVAVDLCVFDVEKSRWKLLKTRYAKISGRIMLCSAISDSTLLMFLITRRKGKGYKLKLISISMDAVPNQFYRLFIGNGQHRIKMPKELQQLSEFSMVNVTNNSILLIGGSYFNDPESINWGNAEMAGKSTLIYWDD